MKNSKVIGIVATGLLAVTGMVGCSDNKADEKTEAPESGISEEVQSGDIEGEATEIVTSQYVTDNGLAGAYALSSIGGDEQKLIDDSQFALIIDEDGTISGTICNTFASSISEDGNTAPGASTKMACEDPAGIMEVENAVISSLDGTIEKNDNVIILKGETESKWTPVEIIDIEETESE